jgi:hypothetical protein
MDDARDLQGRDGDARELFARARPFLAHEGVQVNTVLEDAQNTDGHVLVVNEKTYFLWTKAEAQRMDEDTRHHLATRRTFDVVNGLLDAAHSDERLWLIDDRQRRVAVFLTPAHQMAIRWYAVTAQDAVPTRPTW